MTTTEIAVLVKSIHEGYFSLALPNAFPIPIISSNPHQKTFHSYIMEGSTVSKLDVIRVDYQQRYVLGRFQRYPDSNSAIVYFSKNLNTCWSRYIAAKEMSHVILDRTNESMITNISTIVDWMLNGLEAGSNDALISESAAAQFAAELLVPYDHSQHLLKDASKSSYEIAAIFSVPERIIDILRLPGYIVRRDEAYADL